MYSVPPQPHSVVVAECVCEAREKSHLCLTIPWAVEYLAMMDSHALRVTQHHSLLCQLMNVYRYIYIYMYMYLRVTEIYICVLVITSKLFILC